MPGSMHKDEGFIFTVFLTHNLAVQRLRALKDKESQLCDRYKKHRSPAVLPKALRLLQAVLQHFQTDL